MKILHVEQSNTESLKIFTSWKTSASPAIPLQDSYPNTTRISYSHEHPPSDSVLNTQLKSPQHENNFGNKRRCPLYGLFIRPTIEQDFLLST
jgi:hypothetical protein